MNLGRQSFSSALVAVAAAIVLLGTLYFASFRPGYSHIPNTISELGETGAPQAHWVGKATGIDLPVPSSVTACYVVTEAVLGVVQLTCQVGQAGGVLASRGGGSPVGEVGDVL